MIASEEEIRDFLTNPGRIAILGASTNPSKAGNFVPLYLKKIGFTIVPINPMVDKLFGEPSLKSLDELDGEVVGIIIYRKSEIAEKIAIKAMKRGIPFVWLPIGVTSHDAQEYAIKLGIKYVENKCPKIEGARLLD